MKRALILTVLMTLALGCRPDPGPHLYAQDQEDFAAARAAEEFLEGPDPYETGELRYSVGLFYEGGFSDAVPVDGVAGHYYIYVLGGTDAITYNQLSDNDRVEGLTADRLVHTGLGWWGGGVHWTAPRSLQGFNMLHLSVKSEHDSFTDPWVAMVSGEDVDTGTSVQLPMRDYGYDHDGQWHHLAVPLDDFEAGGFDRSQVVSPFTLGGTGGVAGESLLLDNVYISVD